MTEEFFKWRNKLKDKQSQKSILARLDHITTGNLGDTKFVGGSVFEMRIHTGKGYRLYFMNKSGLIILLLCGGDKSTQKKDIEYAKKLAKEYK